MAFDALFTDDDNTSDDGEMKARHTGTLKCVILLCRFL